MTLAKLKMNQSSIGFLFDNSLLSKRFYKESEVLDLCYELEDLKEYILINSSEKNVIDESNVIVGRELEYDSMFFAIIEFHIQNALGE